MWRITSLRSEGRRIGGQRRDGLGSDVVRHLGHFLHVSARGRGQRHPGGAAADDAQARGGALRKVYGAHAVRWQAVVDGDDDGGAGIRHGDAHAAAERQRRVGGGHGARVEALAARGAPPSLPGAIPARLAAVLPARILRVRPARHGREQHGGDQGKEASGADHEASSRLVREG